MSNKIALFYNPVAGEGRFKYKLDEVIYHLQSYGFQLQPLRINSNQEIMSQATRLAPEEYHSIVAAGGDGTINGVVNAMMKCNLRVPLGIFPEGTSNDVCSFLGIPREVNDYCRVIGEGQIMDCDLGAVNGDYFINVASAGFLTETAHEVDYRLKNALGRMAYYLKAVEKLPRIKPFRMKLNIDDVEYEMEALLFLLLNGGTVGGFNNILPPGSMSDGLMDFLVIRPAPPHRLGRLMHNFYRGRLLHNKDIFYCPGQKFDIKLLSKTSTDLDGEVGPALPWKIQVLPHAIQIRIP